MKDEKAHVAFSLCPVSIFGHINQFKVFIFWGLSQTFRNSTPGLSEAEKLAGSGGKKSSDYLQRNGFQLKNKKKRNFIIYIGIVIYEYYIDYYIYIFVQNKISQAMTKYYYEGPTFKLCRGSWSHFYTMPCQYLFFNKVAGLRPATLFKNRL